MEKAERKNRTSRLRKIELCVWSIVILVVVLIFTIASIKYESSFETHVLYMPDVDGLIIGSPVNIMGISVGYVTKTKIVGENDIRVKFKITNKSVHIPKGTIATVEFNGLGGSKSLELYPPDSTKTPNELVGNNDYILVDRPKRLRDSMALLYQMYKTLMDIIYTTTIFGHEMSSVSVPNISGNPSDFENLIKDSDNYINKYNTNMKKIRETINKYSGGKYEFNGRTK